MSEAELEELERKETEVWPLAIFTAAKKNSTLAICWFFFFPLSVWPDEIQRQGSWEERKIRHPRTASAQEEEVYPTDTCSVSQHPTEHVNMCKVLYKSLIYLYPPPPLCSNYEQPTKDGLNSDNIGNKMLQAMGWKEGKGLGRNQQGITTPIAVRNPPLWFLARLWLLPTAWVPSKRTDVCCYPLQAQLRTKGAGLGTKGTNYNLSASDTYKDAVRKAMFARFTELEDWAECIMLDRYGWWSVIDCKIMMPL